MNTNKKEVIVNRMLHLFRSATGHAATTEFIDQTQRSVDDILNTISEIYPVQNLRLNGKVSVNTNPWPHLTLDIKSVFRQPPFYGYKEHDEGFEPLGCYVTTGEHGRMINYDLYWKKNNTMDINTNTFRIYFGTGKWDMINLVSSWPVEDKYLEVFKECQIRADFIKHIMHTTQPQ